MICNAADALVSKGGRWPGSPRLYCLSAWYRTYWPSFVLNLEQQTCSDVHAIQSMSEVSLTSIGHKRKRWYDRHIQSPHGMKLTCRIAMPSSTGSLDDSSKFRRDQDVKADARRERLELSRPPIHTRFMTWTGES